MRKLISTIALIVATVATFAQDWNVPKKFNSIEFAGNLVIGNMLGIDTSSSLSDSGKTLIVDVLEDGRYFFNTSSFVTVTDTGLILSSISDTATQLRSELSDSSTLLKTTIADSSRWVLDGGGSALIQANTDFSVVIGQTTPVSGVDFYVNGLVAGNLKSVNIDVEQSVDVGGTNIIDVTPDSAPLDTVTSITGAVSNMFITIRNSSAAPVVFSVSGFAGNSQTLRTPSAANIIIPEYGMVTLYAKNETEFWQYTTVIDND
jgi:hypothetical protein